MFGKLFPFVKQTGLLCNSLRTASTNATPGKFGGKVAIVTASTDGIGLAVARRLGQDGAKVMVSSRKQDNVDRTVKELQSENLQVEGMVCHVGKPEDRMKLIEKTVSRFGGLDILVSNAAASPAFGSRMLDIPASAWDKIFDTNLKASFYLCKESAPYMEHSGGGSVVFMSSYVGYAPSQFHFMGAYAVSKMALVALTKALVPQLSTMNIRVNCVAPGAINTKMFQPLGNNPEIMDMIMQNIPVKRIGEPEEVSGVVLFLCSDDASFITGETILITGGMPGRM